MSYIKQRFNSLFLAIILGLTLTLGGCSIFGGGSDDEAAESVRDSNLSPTEAAQKLFDRGEYLMNATNYDAAIQMFELLETRYPLSSHTRQAQINLIYAYYQRKKKELAIDAANQFIKENPVHSKLDYVYYILGLVHFDDENNRAENILRVDKSKRPQENAQNSIEYFETLIRKYPNSEYATDAKQRIIYLREIMAKHDMHVAKYYARRGIHIAAVNRAKNVLEQYPDTKASRQALDLLENSYRAMGMTDLMTDIQRVKQAN